eukprot:CAMPEP_0181050034 /NCGR_PEP_ID=MMETSP1070-20121207/16302_1 /TAXON_ID=265543 /ORGANISM="Minutocellus polymorphus, Strain NH13" /LENGTH=542 /DNA_ID=CAMNT_0023128955 /DNA_START=95 /DNA_END=1724 /DNA_ORIENTATION=+
MCPSSVRSIQHMPAASSHLSTSGLTSIRHRQDQSQRTITSDRYLHVLESTGTEDNASDSLYGNRSSRRDFLSDSAAAATVLSIIAASASSPISAYANDDAMKEDGKVALRTSTSNIPARYAGTSAQPVPNDEFRIGSNAASSPEVLCGPDPDERRIAVFERVAPSVVYIDTFIEARDAFSPNVMEVPLGAGSGFVWDDKGHIVTNYHVVNKMQQAQVAILTKVMPDAPTVARPSPSVANRSQQNQEGQYRTSMRPTSLGSDMMDFTRKIYKAKVIGVDPGKDIAVLKVDAPVYDLYPISVGSSAGLRVGQACLAIGNPFGLDHTLTSGIISGMGREIKSPVGRPISNVIQTDAAINPGNSGGPLLDGKTGKLIGMSTAIYSTSGASAGIGFAIPVDSVKFIVETLIRDGRVIRPVLGVSLLESRQARALGINKGVLVLNVPTTSPAFKAGMKGTSRTEAGLIEIGDIIIRVDDKSIDTEADLFQALENYKPGDRIKVTVNRPGNESPSSTKLRLKEVTLTVQLTSSDMIKNIMSLKSISKQS